MINYVTETKDANEVEYDARVDFLVKEGMGLYDAKVKALREDFVRKDVIAMCIMSGETGVCDSNCSLFGRCWVNENKLETTVTSIERAQKA